MEKNIWSFRKFKTSKEIILINELSLNPITNVLEAWIEYPDSFRNKFIPIDYLLSITYKWNVFDILKFYIRKLLW